MRPLWSARRSRNKGCSRATPRAGRPPGPRYGFARSEPGRLGPLKPHSGSFVHSMMIGVLQAVAPPPPRASFHAHTCPFGHGGVQMGGDAAAAAEIRAAAAAMLDSLKAQPAKGCFMFVSCV